METVLGELLGVEAIGLSPDMAGVGRIDDGRAAPPRQAQRHVVLACGLAGITKFAGGNVDPMFPQDAQDRCLGRAQLAPERRHLPLDLELFPTVGNQDADLEESRVAVDTNAILVELLARLSLPIGDGGGQQFSCRCCVRHGSLEFPRRKTPIVASMG